MPSPEPTPPRRDPQRVIGPGAGSATGERGTPAGHPGCRSKRSPALGHGCADLLEHVLLPFADQLRLEAHESAFLGRVRSGFGGADQPTSERGRLLWRRVLVDDRADVGELLENLIAGRRTAAGAVALDGVVVLLHLCLDVEGDLAQQLLPARRV